MATTKKGGKKGGNVAKTDVDDLDAILKEIEQEIKPVAEKQGVKKKNKGNL